MWSKNTNLCFYTCISGRGTFLLKQKLQWTISVFHNVECLCCVSSQSPRWAWSRARSAAAAGASARTPTTSQKTATFRATTTCCPSGRAPRPPQTGSAVNDPTGSWCPQPWDSQGAEWRGRAPSSLVYHLSWLLICPAENCCTLSRISARGLCCAYKWQMDKCHTLGILIILFFFFFHASKLYRNRYATHLYCNILA